MTQAVFCETVELAVEASALASALGLFIDAQLTADPLDASVHHVASTGAPACALLLSSPSVEKAVSALEVCKTPNQVVIGSVSESTDLARGLLSDLGFVVVLDVAPALAALSLLASKVPRPQRVNGKKLSALDKLRFSQAVDASEKGLARLLSLGADGVAVQPANPATHIKLGHARVAAQALAALQHAERFPEAELPLLPSPGMAAGRDVLFGPPRMLSDPASKAALLPFGLPMPQEELCASPSRAAVEATRIGFPVRISLASPDLRVWDFPELSVDGVDNAARVRDVYRQLQVTATARAPSARVLGVTVTATTLARALLRVTARPLEGARVYLRIGFCDPHGAVSKDATATVLPNNERGIRRALDRLVGRALLWDEAENDAARPLITLLVSLASFVHEFRTEVARVELHPVAMLVGGGAEVREAAVQVTDAFVRGL